VHLPAGADAGVLDLATGSGAIALAIASERPACRVTGTDISPEAIDIACANAGRLHLGRVEFLPGSWYEPVAGRSFDLISSNPPYIANDDPRIERSVQRFEPRASLYAGPAGLEAFSEIIEGAPRHLRSNGWLVLEHGDTQGEAVRRLLSLAGFVSVATHCDLAGRDRCTEAMWTERAGAG
jgi:release factor glutamine methyltransferase